jgi:predicted ATPase
MIISFSGAQSTGKTTLLKHLQSKNGDEIKFVPEVTRLINRTLNLPINENGGVLTQTMIMAEHVRNVYSNTFAKHAILDRCALDGVVYTHWLRDVDQVDQGTYLHALNIFNQLKDKYNIIFYTDARDVALEDDGERSIDVSFRNKIINLFDLHSRNLDNIVVLTGTVEERLVSIKNTLALYNLDINI